MSRTRKYSNAEILEALEKARGGIYVAADNLGCSYKTVQRRIETVQELQDVISKYRGRRSDVAEMKLEQAIHAGEQWAILFQLKTQGKDRGYVERQEITGKDGNAIVVSWDDDTNND